MNLKKAKQSFVNTLNLRLEKMSEKTFFTAVLASIFLTAIIEILGRRSIISFFDFLITQPGWFIYNALIILITLIISFFFKKSLFFMAIISIGWLVLGVINSVLQGYRTTPLSYIDFQNIKFGIFSTYVGVLGIAALVLLIAAFLVFAIYVYRSFPNRKTILFKSVLTILTTLIIFTCITVIGVETETISDNWDNMNDAYEHYGFAYCFTRTFVERGIEAPESYKKEELLSIVNTLKTEGEPEIKPNIIIIQLESFMDLKYVNSINLSNDPVPNFTYLKENFITGFVRVPYIGSGTVNTEFEILTGMNLDYFGFGEYPYKSILQQKTCETIAYNLKNLDYRTTALHNYEGTFYDRHLVYANLGFDCFVPIEFMNIVEQNSIGWEKDYIFTPQIMKAMQLSEQTDFIFTVTVQAHGKYPKVQTEDTKYISVSGDIEQEILNEFEYYANQIYEVDKFIGELVKILENYEEPTVLLLYGDHMPSLLFDESDLSAGDRYTMDYVIWSNYGLSGEGKDLEAYQLTAYLFEILGINEGVLTKFHSQYSDDENYGEILKEIEYDMLYGENYINSENRIYEKTDIIYGLEPVLVTKTNMIGNTLYVSGENFTKSSVIFINKTPRETVFISPEMLITSGIDLKYAADIEVKQTSPEGYIFE